MTDTTYEAPERIWIQTDHIPDQCALDKWHVQPDANEASLFTEYVRADLVQAVVAVREAQKAYFKDRSRDNLIASKQAEAALDKMLAAIRKGKE